MRSRITCKICELSTELGTALALTACGGFSADSFRLAQQEQLFVTNYEINTQIDMLWVVDNSASMDVAQMKIRKGFQQFASTYMQPGWDIQLGVITTDTYLANPAFHQNSGGNTAYLNRVVAGSVGYYSDQIFNRRASWVNPASNPTLVNTTNGTFPNGFKYGEIVPVWGADFAKLMAGNHDGPIPGICFEALPYFISGVSDCGYRDLASNGTGTAACLAAVAAERGGALTEDSLTRCVNTTQNDSVRSGSALIKTATYGSTAALVNDFTINVSTGSVGNGSERGLGSVQEFLNPTYGNEVSGNANRLFRQGSLRVIVFVSDEEDQTMDLSGFTLNNSFTPFTGYKCDQASLLTANGYNPANPAVYTDPANPITGVNGYCCNVGANNCRYGSLGLTCAAVTVDGYTFSPSICPVTSNLTSVSAVKTQIDNFFLNLDGSGSTDPNYFVAAIVPKTGASIQALQADRDAQDIATGQLHNHAVDRGARYASLVSAVGNGSMELDLGDTNYNTVLDAIGVAILDKKSTFTLARVPTGQEDMIVAIHRSAGSVETIPSTDYTLSGNVLRVTNTATVLSFAAGDQVLVNYQPKSTSQ